MKKNVIISIICLVFCVFPKKTDVQEIIQFQNNLTLILPTSIVVNFDKKKKKKTKPRNAPILRHGKRYEEIELS